MTAAATSPATTGPQSAHTAATLRGDIEGLRAVAVLMVLLYHAGVPGTGGGFAGVDVFFVISGYLITSQLVREATARGRVNLPRFYARRARRLLPAASLVLVVTLLAGWWVLPVGRRAELGTDVVGATLYVVNWVFARREVDYLAEDSVPSLLQHYWSLSVEEQFYVVWPLLIIAVLWCARRFRLHFRRILALALTALVAASLAWSVVRTADAPGTAYFATTTRVWELGLGALLVLLAPVLARTPRRATTVLALLGLAMILTCTLVVSRDTPWPGSAALLPTVGTALVITAGLAAPDNAAARMLGIPPMRFLGALSYGLYLWHWPALRLLEETRPEASLGLRLTVAAGSVLLAWVTLRLVEDPIRFHPAVVASTARALGLGAVAMAVSTALGAALVLTAPTLERAQPGPGRGAIALVDPSSRTNEELRPVADPAALFTTTGPVSPDPRVATEDLPAHAYDVGCQVPQQSVEIVGPDACWFGDPDGSTTVALVGDSKMLQWITALDPIARQEGWRLKVYTKSSCGFITVHAYPECVEYNRALSAHLARPGQTPDMIFVSMGATETEDKAGMSQSLADNLRPAMDRGARVWFLADNPGARRAIMPGNALSYECLDENRDNFAACSYPGDDGTGTVTLRRAADVLDIPVVDLNQWVCPVEGEQPICPPVIDHTVLFRQGTHLTATYVASLAPVLHHALVQAGAATTPLSEISWELRLTDPAPHATTAP